MEERGKKLSVLDGPIDLTLDVETSFVLDLRNEKVLIRMSVLRVVEEE